MRISSSQIHANGVDSILDQQSRLSHTQVQVATGKRVLRPSDDPVATTQMLRLRQSIETTQQYQANAEAAVNRLSLEDGVLEGVDNVLQRVRELTVRGMNATETNEGRRFIAAEIREALGQVLGMANTKDGSGDYLFAGGMGATQPFAVNGSGGYTYSGDQVQRMLQVGATRQIADGDPGSAVFQLVRNGNGTFVTEGNAANTGTGIIADKGTSGTFTPTLVNGTNGLTLRFIQALPTDPITWEAFATGDATQTPIATGNYTAGETITINGAQVAVTGTPADGDTFEIRASEYQDMFQTLSNIADALETPVDDPVDRAYVNSALNRGLSELDQAIGNVLLTRSSVGSRLNAIESQQYVNDGYLLQSEEILSSVEDLDYADALSRLNQQLAGLQAAQQAYLKVNNLSMFNYL